MPVSSAVEGGAGVSWGIKKLTPQESPGPPLTVQQQEIQHLREKLRQAELTEAIKGAGAMVPESCPRLGPTVFAPISVNGVSTEALVDTGSPAAIVSLEFVLSVLRKNRPKNQTNDQWMELTRRPQTLWRPTVRLHCSD